MGGQQSSYAKHPQSTEQGHQTTVQTHCPSLLGEVGKTYLHVHKLCGMGRQVPHVLCRHVDLIENSHTQQAHTHTHTHTHTMLTPTRRAIHFNMQDMTEAWAKPKRCIEEGKESRRRKKNETKTRRRPRPVFYDCDLECLNI